MQFYKRQQITINIADIDRVEICDELGSGGQGHVWKVAHPPAAKHPDYYVLKHVRLGKRERELGYDERIRREASVRIDSEYVIKCLGFTEPGPDEFLILFPYEPGKTLNKWLQTHPKTPWTAKKRMFFKILEGVCALHRADILHQNLKPQNILIVDRYDTPRILDFGIAKFCDQEGVTLTGQLLGAMPYMAPEVLIEGSKYLDEHYDIYALGAILYEVIVGKNPWNANQWTTWGDFIKLAAQPGKDHLLDIDRKFRFDADPVVTVVIRHSTMFEPEERFRSVDEMISALKGESPRHGDTTDLVLRALAKESLDINVKADSGHVTGINARAKSESRLKPAAPEHEDASASLRSEPARPEQSRRGTLAPGDDAPLRSLVKRILVGIILLLFIGGSLYVTKDGCNGPVPHVTPIPTPKPTLAPSQEGNVTPTPKSTPTPSQEENVTPTPKPTNTPIATPIQTALLTVRSNVYDDNLVIDGESYGRTPVKVLLPLGSHTVQVIKAGCATFEVTLDLQENKLLRARLDCSTPTMKNGD